MMGSLQQPVWTKWQNFTYKGYTSHGFMPQVNFYNVKPCKASHVEGGLVTGKPSSVSFSVPVIGGNLNLPFDRTNIVCE